MDEEYFESYAGLAVHRLMLQDEARMSAFHTAIKAVVGPGKRVMDVGAGTGILSFWAAQAGADDVYAVEHSNTINAAKEIARVNGLEEHVTFMRGMVESIELDEKVDVIVSEWMGYFALAETMFKSFVAARDRHLAPGGVCIPSSISIHLAPIEDWAAYFDDGPGFWELPVYGLDFSSLVDLELNNLVTVSRPIPEKAYLAPPAELIMIDCQTAPSEDFFFDTTVEFFIERGGILQGFAGHFEAELAPGVMLSTASTEPLTHWRQSYFPIRERDVLVGDILRITMRAIDAKRGDRRLPIYIIDGQIIRGGETESFFYRYDASFE